MNPANLQPQNPAPKQAPNPVPPQIKQPVPPPIKQPPPDAGDKAAKERDLPNPIAWNAVPQEEPEKAKARRRAQRDWVRANTIDAYESVGSKNPKWDAAAREALEAAVRMWAGPLEKGHVRFQWWKAAQRAVDAGCDDPFIRYLVIQKGRDLRTKVPDDWVSEEIKVADALVASR